MMMCFVILVHPSCATSQTDPLAFTAFTNFSNFTNVRLSARPTDRLFNAMSGQRATSQPDKPSSGARARNSAPTNEANQETSPSLSASGVAATGAQAPVHARDQQARVISLAGERPYGATSVFVGKKLVKMMSKQLLVCHRLICGDDDSNLPRPQLRCRYKNLRRGAPSKTLAYEGPSKDTMWMLVCIATVAMIIQPSSALNTETTATISAKDLPQQVAQRLKPFHELAPDAFVDPPEFIRLRHFIPEVHHVVTKDNYVLTLHRVINPLVPRELRSRLKPVFLQHGLFTSSFNFIIASDRNTERPRFDVRDLDRTRPLNVHVPEAPWSWKYVLETLNDLTLAKLGLTKHSDRIHAPHISDSMAFELANQGYDVWMGNSRGSTYSLNHTHYDWRHDWRYWDFSFHEMGLYDLPAQLDYVLQLRRRKSLAYIGHSQGNLAMFILQSQRPEWADKVKPFIAMAPIAFVPNVYFGAVRLLLKALSPVLTPRRLNEILKGRILPKSETTERALDLVCVPKPTTVVCDAVLSLILGDNIKRANHSLTPIVAHHIPEGTSILNVLHFGQMIESGQFRTFDFGPAGNKERYGTTVNPFYPIRNIRSRDIAFVVGRTDTLSTMSNVAITRSMLSVPLMDDYVVPDPIWGHADYMYAIGAGRIANAHMIGLCDRYRLVP